MSDIMTNGLPNTSRATTVNTQIRPVVIKTVAQAVTDKLMPSDMAAMATKIPHACHWLPSKPRPIQSFA